MIWRHWINRSKKKFYLVAHENNLNLENIFSLLLRKLRVQQPNWVYFLNCKYCHFSLIDSQQQITSRNCHVNTNFNQSTNTLTHNHRHTYQIYISCSSLLIFKLSEVWIIKINYTHWSFTWIDPLLDLSIQILKSNEHVNLSTPEIQNFHNILHKSTKMGEKCMQQHLLARWQDQYSKMSFLAFVYVHSRVNNTESEFVYVVIETEI